MRIPLDYYRILGLPILATADQVQQSYRDRTLQLPRQEFSTNAVAARKALLNQAFEVLSEADKRREYDARFLASTYEPAPDMERSEQSDSQHSDIEVDEANFVGALLLLQELGEYESVLRLGRPYLKPGNNSLKENRLGDPTTAKSDIVLSIALACLELGREEWQQGHYDNAAEALETGQELLLREGLFPAVRAEVQADLYKLRPYRILAMLSNPEEEAPDRERGLVMLQDMLNERQGIDGRGIDQSGLGVDDFLRFIQQLRDYMTVDEQQALFESEAKRPSAVATYLAVYALLAKGFARQEPALIRRAKSLLMRLGSRQDVYLEQSICALLLGQPEIAAKALERSQEYEPLAFIREHSQGASDLLPGLCLYTERWMQEEVFPHFRDLATHTASLKDYFADPQVQSYLEELPNETDIASSSQWVGAAIPAPPPLPNGSVMNGQLAESSTIVTRLPQERETEDATVGSIGTAAAIGGAAALGGTIAANLMTNPLPETPPNHRNGRRRSRKVEPPAAVADGAMPVPLSGDGPMVSAPPASRPAKRRRGEEAEKPWWILPAVLFLTGLVGYSVVQCATQGNRQNPAAISSAGSVPNSNDLLVSLDEPLIALPGDPVAGEMAGVQGEMNPETAKQVLELWFNAKKAALGPSHQLEKLDLVLTGDKLKEWQEEATGAKAESLSIEYVHNLEVTSVEVSKENPNEATVVANVREQRKYTKAGQQIEDQTDELPLTYTFVRENNQWKIRHWNAS